MRRALVLLAALPLLAQAGTRPRYGGTLKVAVAGLKSEPDPLLADTPELAALQQLTQPGLCRLDARGQAHPVLAQDFIRPLPQRVRIPLRPTPAGEAVLTASDVANAWARLFQSGTASPYRALLSPLRGEARQLPSAAAAQGALEFALAYNWPDFERSLCHPALAVARPKAQPSWGPYVPGPQGTLSANPTAPEGRAFPDRLTLSPTTERGAARLLASKGAHIVLGTGEDSAVSPPALFATYLAFAPQRVGPDFRARFEAAIDRADLVRFFVRAPATAMYQLLPPALMPQQPLPRPAAPAPLTVPKDLTLVFDSGLEDARAVAERIQVRLHDRGYKIALRAVSRSDLRAIWASGDFDLMLHPLLLPPVPGPALAVTMEAAGRHDLLPVELPLIGNIADPSARDARARERAEALRPSLSFIPLYAQGLRVQASAAVANLGFDAQGLPILEEAFLVDPGL
ncbi:MAG TPA: peptide ABC transporter substrate-binding protein [Myxococcaceae bacterium]|nr:peptide ABC transporter substrate-binding protein [Myxococcaceae bacterium]